MIDKREIDIVDLHEKVYGMIIFPETIGVWCILAHQLKRIQPGKIFYFNGNIIREPSIFLDNINVGAEDLCFSKTLGKMNSLLPHSLHLNNNLNKNELILYAYKIFTYVFNLSSIITQINQNYTTAISSHICRLDTCSGTWIEIPSCFDLNSSFATFTIFSKHVLQELLNLIQYMYKETGKYSSLVQNLSLDNDLRNYLSSELSHVLFIWNLRNAYEHPKKNNYCYISNFMYDKGNLVPPTMRYMYNGHEISEDNLLSKINELYDFLLNFTENIFSLLVSNFKSSC